jgi:Family of unknown function (DUF6516)
VSLARAVAAEVNASSAATSEGSRAEGRTAGCLFMRPGYRRSCRGTSLCVHGWMIYKYRLYYGRAGKRLVGYDNERGKGDHRHRRGREEPYCFTTVQQLMSDFLTDVAEERKR